VITPLPFPRGVASPDGTRGFIEMATTGVAALDLSSGVDLWHHTMPARPRLVIDDRLVAQDLAATHGHVLRFLLLSIGAGGSVVLRTAPLSLPDWVSVDDPEQNVRVELFGGTDHFTIVWRVEAYYQGGAPPPASVEARSHRVLGGAARVDLATGAVTAQADPPSAAEQPVRLTAIAVESAPYIRDLTSHDSPWQVDGVTAALAKPDNGDRLVLRRWTASGDELSSVTLAAHRDSIADVTPDGHYVFVRAEPDGRSDASQRWDVFSVAAGKQTGSVPYEHGATWPCVVHGRVFYLVEATRASAPRRTTLKAFDLATGRELWRKVLPDAAVAAPPARRM
jgi:hypothetical protein